ncbi:MAG: hypothetical protein IH608_07865 [Proteobacteria bacterium]|nr:hypothetical protein [Pseudomonadota bacterium]
MSRVPNLTTLETDMNRHVVTVGFDDQVVQLPSVIQALNDAGYTVGEPRKLE